MSNQENTQNGEKKKVSLQELMKQQLEKKKQAQGNGNQSTKSAAKNQVMKSQMTKKASNTRRKMGV
ncbi:hypothetical protein [Bacillus infantis]|uniref:Uncharacterized protein n=1 Tax=Bacillus infantis TaxID=324767 RepID=A0A5D4RQZ2_9BACI|nr:hypothetical protein [Bacillus infantis]TYS51932.1 hypothetical protein FZD51_00320 [Bacillus infantis]